MKVEVHKFGGSCLKDTRSLRQVIDLLGDYPDSIAIVVVSAVYGVTNLFRHLISKTITTDSINDLLKAVEMKCEKIADIPPSVLSDELINLRKILNGMLFADEYSDNAANLILTYGERLMVKILKHLIPGSRILYPEQFMITDKTSGRGTYLLDETKRRFKELRIVDEPGIILVPGFYGITEAGVVNTVGRSGTDYTGAVLAHTSNAASYTIWKDVNGFMTTDPTMYENARIIDTLSYEEAEELSFFGASLLHEKTIPTIKKDAIPLIIRNIHSPDNFTTIESSINNSLKSISYIKEVELLRVFLTSVQDQGSRLSKVGSILEKSNIHVYALSATFTTLSYVVSMANNRSTAEFDELNTELIKNQSLIAMVGENSTDSDAIKSLFQLFKKEEIPINFLSHGINKRVTYLLCNADRLDKAIATLHQLYF